MINRARSAVATVATTVRRHGGGLEGSLWLLGRAYRLLRALGPSGLLQRYRMLSATSSPVAPPIEFDFPHAVPLEQITLRVGVMVHLFYAHMVDEIAAYLANMPVRYVLLVSVADEESAEAVSHRLSQLTDLAELHVRKVPNRGRDLSPLFVEFREQILKLDVIGHIHTKKSLYTGTEQRRWRSELLDSLLGSPQRLSWIFGTFQAVPKLGIVFPESPREVPYWGHTWLRNEEACRALGQRLGIEVEHGRYFDFPAGSMFWARAAAIAPLFDLKLGWNDFPPESGQTDGTLQHALERMLAVVVRRFGWLSGVLAQKEEALAVEGGRNWESYFQSSVANRLTAGNLEADIVSVDIFDTLVLRPFLTPNGARDYMAWLAQSRLGISNFARIRHEAEVLARSRKQGDVGLAEIYAAMSDLPGINEASAHVLQELELTTEASILRPRHAVVDAVRSLVSKGRRIVAVSDMYLGSDALERVTPAQVRELIGKRYVSCETGWRKDTGEAWKHLPEVERVAPARWLHVGDNEASDVQAPHDLGFAMPVHVLRPSAMLDVVPQLRALRPAEGGHVPWQEQLWLGLVANHFAELADRDPGTVLKGELLPTPESVGYAVLGPLVMDYLAWLSRMSLERGGMRLLFLSREGFLLDRAFNVMKAAVPALSGVPHTYLLASRRGVGTPSLHRFDDILHLLGSSFEGSLMELLVARVGADTAKRVRERLGELAMSRTIYLPEMREQVVDMLSPAAEEILQQAALEREAYLRYWNSSAGRGIVADLGYAGTIQAHLSRLTGTALGGGYFTTNERIAQIEPWGSWAHARYFHDDGTGSTVGPVMRHHLLLETFLTSPDGQFSHFRDVGGQQEPVFLEREHGARAAELISRVHDGTLCFVQDVCAIVGDGSHLLSFDLRQVQVPLQLLGAGLWRTGAWMSELGMVDAFTGRGAVPVNVGP